MQPVPTTSQLQHAIDSGATGEKVSYPDPAAAPLGTDAEAGGHAPTEPERAMEARSQNLHRESKPVNGVPIYLLLIGMVTVAIVLIGMLA